ncbi:type I secretion system permease/ATPase, partial [Rhizobium leguminosarum bv. viciae]
MNQISKQIFAAGSALDLRSGIIPSAAPLEAAMSDVCISAIDQAVENLRRLSGAVASSPDGGKKTVEVAARETADIGGASTTQPPLTQKTVTPEASNVKTAPPAAAQSPVTAKPMEAPAQPRIEARVPLELPKEKTELKSSPTMPFGKTIEGESGPISENDRRLRTGGGGNGKDSDPGGDGG